MAGIKPNPDYYPGGMLMPGRCYPDPATNTKPYKHGYQGSLKDDEISGPGNTYNTFFRELDVRTLRWWSIDPEGVPYESPYVSMGDNPILNNDILGNKIPPWQNTFKDRGLANNVNNTYVSLNNSSKVFKSVYNYLVSVENVYRIKESKNTQNMFIDGTYANKNINYFYNNAHYPTSTAVFEETYHAGQDEYYSNKGIKQTGLQTEVEAKVMQLVEGFTPEDVGVGTGVNVNALKQYFKESATGKVNQKTLKAFKSETGKVAKQTLELYRSQGELKGKENNLENYKQSFDFSKEMVKEASDEKKVSDRPNRQY